MLRAILSREREQSEYCKSDCSILGSRETHAKTLRAPTSFRETMHSWYGTLFQFAIPLERQRQMMQTSHNPNKKERYNKEHLTDCFDVIVHEIVSSIVEPISGFFIRRDLRHSRRLTLLPSLHRRRTELVWMIGFIGCQTISYSYLVIHSSTRRVWCHRKN